jgi:pimeloyl-ACP methyl ester carboxylesterase
MIRRAFLLLLALSLPAPVSAQLNLAPCTIPEVEGDVRCGTYRVYEDRETRKGRQIDLNLVVLRALGGVAARQPDPLFVLQGGPGQGVAQLSDYYARLFAGVRIARDIVLLDLRGTGKSNALICPQLGAPDAKGHFDDSLLAPAAIAACRAAVASRADVTKYTTVLAMADLDEVRRGLGYERINLYGTSYGTYAAQVYVRDFAQRVRTVSMKGVVPFGELAPVAHARDGELAWRQLVARCAADVTCRTHYSTLDEDLRAVVARLTAKAATLPVKQADGTPGTIMLSAGIFGEIVRNMLYTPESAARLPSLIRQVAKGELSVLGPLAMRTRNLLAGIDLAAGFFLSVTCTEGVALVDPQIVGELTRGSFAGDYRLRQQIRACESWPRGDLFRGHLQPITSDVALLMLSGELDPVTPPSRGEELLKFFQRGTHVVAANNGHPFGKLEGCGNVLIARFIEKGSMNDVDTSCAKAIPPVPFAVP